MSKLGKPKHRFFPILVMLGGFTCISIVGLSSFLLWKIPIQRVESAQNLSTKERYELENATRTSLAQAFGTLSQAIGGTVVLIGVYFAWRNLIAIEEKQITERFTRAIEQLGNEEASAIRLGAIYSLERIARDSVRDHWVVMEILAAYIREKAALQKHENKIEVVSEDIQAALTVIKRRDASKDPEYAFLNLSRTYLRKADLRGEEIKLIGFWKKKSNNSNLSNIDFTKANMAGVNLSRSTLINSNFTEADLSSVDFSEAIIRESNFSSAILKDVKGLSVANSSGKNSQ